jgi:hypothetical protein
MSAGYFTRLIQRAHGESGGIRPAIPACYAGQFEAGGLDEIQPEPMNEQRPGPIRAVKNEEGPAQKPVVRTEQKGSEPDLTVKPSPQRITQTVSEQGEPAETRAVQTNLSKQPRQRETSEPTSPTHPDEIPAARGEPQPAESANAAPRAERQAEAPAQAAQAPPASEERLLLPEIRTVRLVQSGSMEHPSAQKTQEPAPTPVRISIGRIEVRTVQPPPVVPTPRVDPHPAMSLDEYLRRLNEERR